MSTQDTVVSHIAVCASDLDHSIRFYTEVFGFALDQRIDIGAPFETLTELPPIKGSAAFLNKDGVRLELVSYQTPEMIGPAERPPMNQLGLTHLAFTVTDLDAVIGRMAANGGTVIDQTRVSTPAGDLIFCTDPDGVRLELWQKPEGGAQM